MSMQNSQRIIQHILSFNKKKLAYYVLIALVPTVLYALYIKSEKARYLAYSKIFPLSFNSSGGGGTFAAIKAQLGISDKTDYDKIYNIFELVNSRTVSFRVVQSPCSNKKYKNLAGWILADHNENLKLFKKKLIPDPKDTSDIYYLTAELMLMNTQVVSEKTDFTKIMTSFHDPELSREVNRLILKTLSSYYIQLATEKPNSEVVKLQVIRDSLKSELDGVEEAIAGYQDANQLSVKYATGIPQARLLRKRAEVEQLYETAVTAYQNANFKLLSESPIFQILDSPAPPYYMLKPSVLKNSIMFFFACVLFVMILFNLRFLKDLMKMTLD